MDKITSQLSVLITAATLFCGAWILTLGGLEYCGQPESVRSKNTKLSPGCPTLAPRPQMVVLSVEADKSDLEVGWAD